MEVNISRDLVPDTLVEESAEVELLESHPRWKVMIEHTGSDRLIEVGRRSREEAIELLDRIEAAFDSATPRIRIEPDHLVSLKSFRQAWVAEFES